MAGPGTAGQQTGTGHGAGVRQLLSPQHFVQTRGATYLPERDCQIVMINLKGYKRSCIKSKLFHLVHLHLSHLHQPRVEVLGTAWASVPAVGPMVQHGQCSGLLPQAKGLWVCSCLGGITGPAAGWEHGGGSSHMLFLF